jgi:hypothetical protein
MTPVTKQEIEDYLIQLESAKLIYDAINSIILTSRINDRPHAEITPYGINQLLYQYQTDILFDKRIRVEYQNQDWLIVRGDKEIISLSEVIEGYFNVGWSIEDLSKDNVLQGVSPVWKIS